jgi:hypothetical protein
LPFASHASCAKKLPLATIASVSPVGTAIAIVPVSPAVDAAVRCPPSGSVKPQKHWLTPWPIAPHTWLAAQSALPPQVHCPHCALVSSVTTCPDAHALASRVICDGLVTGSVVALVVPGTQYWVLVLASKQTKPSGQLACALVELAEHGRLAALEPTDWTQTSKGALVGEGERAARGRRGSGERAARRLATGGEPEGGHAERGDDDGERAHAAIIRGRVGSLGGVARAAAAHPAPVMRRAACASGLARSG